MGKTGGVEDAVAVTAIVDVEFQRCFDPNDGAVTEVILTPSFTRDVGEVQLRSVAKFQFTTQPKENRTCTISLGDNASL